MRLVAILIALALAATPVGAQGSAAAIGESTSGALLVEMAATPDASGVFYVTASRSAPQAASLGYDLPPSIVAEEKSPVAGFILSFVLPGMGHLYAGEWRTGLNLMVLGLGAPALGCAIYARSDSMSPAPCLVGAFVGLGAYIYNVIDGAASVTRYNEANGFALVPVPMESGAGLAVRVGL